MKRIVIVGMMMVMVAGGAEIRVKDGGALSQAILEARQMRTQGEKGTIRVILGDGRYSLTEALVLTPGDSGLEICAEHAGKAVISGGRKLPCFTVGADGLWHCAVGKGVHFEQLWVNGLRAQRAITPNGFAEYLLIKEYVPESEHLNRVDGRKTKKSRTAFIAESKDVAVLAGKSAAELSNVIVRAYHSWEVSEVRVTGLDAKTGLVRTTGVGHWPYGYWGEFRQRYRLENYREALDASGEWYLDEGAGELLYKPRAGERIETAEAVAPVTDAWLTFAGDRAKGVLVKDIRLSGLRFEYSGYTLPPEGESSCQAAVECPAAITADGAEGLVIENCQFEHIGAHAIHLRKGVRHCLMRHSLVRDIGGSAFRAGDASWSKAELPHGITGFLTVEDCILQSGGRQFPGATGVWLGHATDVTISHNDIGDFLYTGVSMGWTWGYAETPTRNQRIVNNHIHHISQCVLSDLGGFYSLGDQRGSIVSGNRIHDVYNYGYPTGGSGLYTDEGSRGILFASNIVYRTGTGSVHQHYGRENTFYNNIFAETGAAVFARSRREKHRTVNAIGNIFYSADDRAVSGEVATYGKMEDAYFASNLYWRVSQDVAGKGFQFMNAKFADWQKLGQDVGARVGDPKFADLAHGDFTLAADSPALALGFRPWKDVAGVCGDAAWKREAARCAPAYIAPADPIRAGRTSVQEGFEALAVGDLPSDVFNVSEDTAVGATVRADAAAAHTGKMGLCFREKAAAKYSFVPHLYMTFGAFSKTVTLRAAVKVCKGCGMSVEVRDCSPKVYPFAAVATISFSQGGDVIVYGRRQGSATSERLTRVTPGTWMTLEFQVKPDGMWHAAVTPVGGTRIATAEFEPRTPKAQFVHWLGFMTDGADNSVWYLDDLEVGGK